MKIEAVQGNITLERVDAVVNEANSALFPGGGLCGAIYRAAGPAIQGECRLVRRTIYPDGVPVGAAVATGGGMLAARWVIHTVGPNAHRGETDSRLLASCFVSSLREAAEVGARSIAFPPVSVGIFGWEPHVVARVAVDAVRDADARGIADVVELVRFVLPDPDTYEAFSAAMAPRAVAVLPS